MSASATVTVARTSPEDVAQRQIIVRVDDHPKKTLLHGQSCTFDVPAGEHRLKCHNTLVRRSAAFTLAPGEHATFLVVNRASRWTFGFLTLLGVAPLTMTIEKVETRT